MPQFSFGFCPDGVNWCLLEDKFAVRKVCVSWWKIVQFISQHSWMCLLTMVDGIQGGVIALFLEDGISHFGPVDQGLIG